MTTKTRTTDIQIETHQIKIIRFRGNHSSVPCERCRETVPAATPRQTAELLVMALSDVFRLIDADRFHLVGPARPFPLVCGKSLGSLNPLPDTNMEENESRFNGGPKKYKE